MIQPSLEQQRILAAPLGPMRIAAGAGTGKTTTISLYVAHLVERGGFQPEEVLGLTFTNKAAAELSDRIREMVAPLSGAGREADVHTYHGFAAQVVREFGALVGLERDSAVITPTFSRQLLLDAMERRHFEHVDLTWRGVVERVQRLGDSLGDHLVDPADLTAVAEDEAPWPERLELLAAWADYAGVKQRLGVVDYADLIAAAVKLTEHHPDVAARLRRRYRVVLLDEYQDTNPAQRILLQQIFGDGFPVVAVGDADQTIYEWRGATPDNFDSFGDHFRTSSGEPAADLRLSLNRRSDRAILTIANEIKTQIGSAGLPLAARPEADEGFVGTRWAADAVVEADWIADEAIRLHDEGTPWREMAVLFRNNRHISLVHDAFTERGIPVEVANLGGLLAVPEVADIRAWMSLIHTPEDGPSLLRILLGPRYRLGLGDLAPLARWSRHEDEATRTPAIQERALDHEGVPAHSMLEAIEHLDALEGLDERARLSLERFAIEYRKLLEAAQGLSLAELTRTILDVTGAWSDVEAMEPAGRLSARLNLYRFLDLTEEWSPLEGRPSLAAFLEHLALMEENPADELDAARLSGEDAVTMLTVHRAKGLEWDVVFIPAVVHHSFPTRSRSLPDPYRKAEFLPHEWRRDAPPPIDATTPDKEARAILRDHHLRQEWRTAYVAVTRARRRLYVTGAHWYGVPEPTKKPSPPSELYELVAGSDVTHDFGTDPEPPRPEVLRAADRLPAPDPLFPDGWAAALREAVADPETVDDLADELGISDAVDTEVETLRARLFDLDAVAPVTGEGEPAVTSVTGLVTYAACPRRYYWSEVDRLPRRPNPAARRGVSVHRQIELHGLGHVPLTEVDPGFYDLVEEDRDAGPDAFSTFLDSDYAARRPARSELAFQFPTGAGVTVRGRIDAIYVEDGAWDIVDFKTGRRRSDPWLPVQLQAYAVAASRVDLGLGEPTSMSVAFVYLGGGLDVNRQTVDEIWAATAEAKIESLAEGIASESYDPTPSSACRSCEFSRFCPAGQAWLDTHPE